MVVLVCSCPTLHTGKESSSSSSIINPSTVSRITIHEARRNPSQSNNNDGVLSVSFRIFFFSNCCSLLLHAKFGTAQKFLFVALGGIPPSTEVYNSFFLSVQYPGSFWGQVCLLYFCSFQRYGELGNRFLILCYARVTLWGDGSVRNLGYLNASVIADSADRSRWTKTIEAKFGVSLFA